MKNLIPTLAIIAIISGTAVLFNTQCKGPKAETTTTDVIIKNTSNFDSVQVFVTLQSTDTVTGMWGISAPSNPNVPCKGSFWAQKGTEYHMNRPRAVQGAIVTFMCDNYACDAAIAKGWYMGVNAFEFTVNVPYESADITCLDGLNSIIKYSVSDTVNWNTGAGVFKTATCKWPLHENYNIPGVFPYQCDVCNGSQFPPKPNCFGDGKCSSVANCQINRANKKGGSIVVEFIDEIPVPASK